MRKTKYHKDLCMKIQSKWELKGWKNIKTLSYRAILETFWDDFGVIFEFFCMENMFH